jgi:phosphoribosylformimino-5-aminoimidazole carboxamide ribotide isomerase
MSADFSILPAIDLLGGRSVRLLQGKRDSAHVVHADALAHLRALEERGARWVHVVDLDAAFGDAFDAPGRLANRELLSAIVGATRLKVEVGGGVRGPSDARALLEAGVARVIVGTWCVREPEAVMALARAHPGRVVAGLDALDGRVAVAGWTETSSHTVEEFGARLAKGGVTHALFTEVERDGLLSGIDAPKAGALAYATGLSIIASGGVRDVEDIRALASTAGVCGVVVGKALAAGTLALEDALAFQRPEA